MGTLSCVEFIPKVLDEGVLYISRRFNTASHLCCCGCSFKVVIPVAQISDSAGIPKLLVL